MSTRMCACVRVSTQVYVYLRMFTCVYAYVRVSSHGHAYLHMCGHIRLGTTAAARSACNYYAVAFRDVRIADMSVSHKPDPRLAFFKYTFRK